MFVGLYLNITHPHQICLTHPLSNQFDLTLNLVHNYTIPVDQIRLSNSIHYHVHLWFIMGQTSHIRPTTCGCWICQLGPGSLIPQLGLTSCLSPIRICALRPHTLGSTLVAAGYAGRVRAGFHHKCNLTSCQKCNYNL